MDPEVIALFIPFAGIVMIIFIVWFGTRARQAQVQAKTELHKYLLDKFSSGTELAQFLETEGGKRMVQDLGRSHATATERIQRPVTAGAVLTSLGVAFLLLTTYEPDLVIVGGILFAIGIGFLIAAFVTFRLSKSQEADNGRSTPGGQTAAGSQDVGGSGIV